jgi:hypothetical protein
LFFKFPSPLVGEGLRVRGKNGKREESVPFNKIVTPAKAGIQWVEKRVGG